MVVSAPPVNACVEHLCVACRATPDDWLAWCAVNRLWNDVISSRSRASSFMWARVARIEYGSRVCLDACLGSELSNDLADVLQDDPRAFGNGGPKRLGPWKISSRLLSTPRRPQTILPADICVDTLVLQGAAEAWHAARRPEIGHSPTADAKASDDDATPVAEARKADMSVDRGTAFISDAKDLKEDDDPTPLPMPTSWPAGMDIPRNFIQLTSPGGITTSWEASEAKVPGFDWEAGPLPSNEVAEAMVERRLTADDGLLSISRVLQAHLVNKRRLLVFRRYWWHKVRQLQFERGLRSALELAAGPEPDPCPRIVLALLCLRLPLVPCAQIPLWLGMLCTPLVLLPLWLDGYVHASLLAICVPVLIGLGVLSLDLLHDAWCQYNAPVPPLHVFALKRAAGRHRNAAARVAMRHLADLSTDQVDALAPDQRHRLTRCQLAGIRLDALIAVLTPVVTLGLVCACITALCNFDGPPSSVGWFWVLSCGTIPLAARLALIALAGTLVCLGPALDAHARPLLTRPRVWTEAYLSEWLVFAQLILVGRQLDAYPVGIGPWAAVLCPLWLLIALHAFGCLRARPALARRRDAELLVGLVAACLATFASLICGQLDGSITMPAVQLWIPLWISLFPIGLFRLITFI